MRERRERERWKVLSNIGFYSEKDSEYQIYMNSLFQCTFIVLFALDMLQLTK